MMKANPHQVLQLPAISREWDEEEGWCGSENKGNWRAVGGTWV